MALTDTEYYVPDYGNSDDDKADELLAKVSQIDYERYLKEYRPRELALIQKAKTDTTLIDDAIARANQGPARAQAMVDRMEGRYGANLTAAQRQQRDRTSQLAGTTTGIQTVADARLAQSDANRALLADLINIGQGVNRSSLQQMQTAAQGQIARQNAEEQYKAQMYNTLGVALLSRL
jgi:hypothetical protein